MRKLQPLLVDRSAKIMRHAATNRPNNRPVKYASKIQIFNGKKMFRAEYDTSEYSSNERLMLTRNGFLTIIIQYLPYVRIFSIVSTVRRYLETHRQFCSTKTRLCSFHPISQTVLHRLYGPLGRQSPPPPTLILFRWEPPPSRLGLTTSQGIAWCYNDNSYYWYFVSLV